MSLCDSVSEFESLAHKHTGFKEPEVALLGGGSRSGVLSRMCRVPTGIEYPVNGRPIVFDTLEHLMTFLEHGVPDNVHVWAKGGVMSDFVSVFGEDHGAPMRARHGDMIGHIPQLIVSPGRASIRASHGILLLDTPARNSSKRYDEFWRGVIHAKFECPAAREALLATGGKYLIDRDFSCEEWGASIRYPGPEHSPGSGACTCSRSAGDSKDCPVTRDAKRAKKRGVREGGELVGRNRMGKYLMAVRAELAFLGSQPDAA